MKSFARGIAASVCFAALGLGAAQPSAAAVAASAKADPHQRLMQLFKDSDEANLKRNPVAALYRGDLRFADRLGNSLTDQYYAAERDAAKR